eukprot:TRINITY_DN8771_c0_g2_i2.p1 TRINITY_DN8771_c0_g2~~TRINITY_DN8771_c0_g2_i2.p1  ORF type:complete len:272 (+),score=31.82 TRINITY_DN8771_c0_g2_i2:249-1064(+)
MELMLGGSLRSVLQRSGSLTMPFIRRCLRDVTDGLDYLHRNRIMHRDIKPENILLDLCDHFKLADFGLARRCAGVDDATLATFGNSTGVGLCGTPRYMSPEILKGVTERPADIWAVGMMGIELVTGRTPWSHLDAEINGKSSSGASTNAVALLFHIYSNPQRHPIPEGINELLADFLDHCTALDPADRWTAAQLLKHPLLQPSPSTDIDDPSTGILRPHPDTGTFSERNSSTREVRSRSQTRTLPVHPFPDHLCVLIQSGPKSLGSDPHLP